MMRSLFKQAPYDEWSAELREVVQARYLQGDLIKDIATSLRLNPVHIGAYLRSVGIDTRTNTTIPPGCPTPEEIQERALAIRRQNIGMGKP